MRTHLFKDKCFNYDKQRKKSQRFEHYRPNRQRVTFLFIRIVSTHLKLICFQVCVCLRSWCRGCADGWLLVADCVPDTEPSVEDCAPDCEAPVEDCANDDEAPVVDHLLPLEDCVLDVEAPDVDCAWPKVNCVSDTDDVGQAAIGLDWQGSWSLEGFIISQIFWNFFTFGSYGHNYLNLLGKSSCFLRWLRCWYNHIGHA